jgi:allophanate hydrolase subunit 2
MRWGGKVFVRQGKARVPLKPIVGPSAKQLMGDAVIANVIQKTLDEVAQKNFESALSFATGATVDIPE